MDVWRETPDVTTRKVTTELHPVSITRFLFVRTQTLESLSVDSVTNGFLSNPDPGENLVSGNLVMETGCNMLGLGHYTRVAIAGRDAESGKARQPVSHTNTNDTTTYISTTNDYYYFYYYYYYYY